MKKINLKNILKKTFKNKKSTKSKLKKKVIAKKQKKVTKKIKIVKITKNKDKLKTKVEENTNQNLRIPKGSGEQKPEIKKVKKQLTEKKSIKLKITSYTQNMAWDKSQNLKK